MLPRLLRDSNEPTDHDILPGGVSPAPDIVRQRPQVPVAARRSDAKRDSDKFQVTFSAKTFRPDEIDVKTVDNFVVIHGKHEELPDEYGFVSREFTRRCQLPDDVEPRTATASLRRDGLLTIEAPRKRLEPPPKKERIVPVTMELLAAVVGVQKRQRQFQEQQQQQLQAQQQQLQEQQQQLQEQQQQLQGQQQQLQAQQQQLQEQQQQLQEQQQQLQEQQQQLQEQQQQLQEQQQQLQGQQQQASKEPKQ